MEGGRAQAFCIAMQSALARGGKRLGTAVAEKRSRRSRFSIRRVKSRSRWSRRISNSMDRVVALIVIGRIHQLVIVPRQPFLRGLAVRCEMDEFGMIAGAVEDAATADARTFDNAEGQAGFQRERAVDANGDDTVAAIVTFMQRDVCRQDDVAGDALVLLADQPAGAVAGLPGGQLFAMPFGRARCAVGPFEDGADRRQKCDMCRHAGSP